MCHRALLRSLNTDSGITDGKAHTQKETGQKFGISGNRVGQLEARMKYEIGLQSKMEVHQ